MCMFITVSLCLKVLLGISDCLNVLLRFEKLDITPRSALKIRPVLENWLREAEEKHQQEVLLSIILVWTESHTKQL